MAELSVEPHLRVELLSQARFLVAVRGMIGALAHRVGFDEIQCGQVSLAVDEALCNIINHGYDKRPDGRIWISIWVEQPQPGLKIVIEDRARQVDPSTIRSRDLEDIRPGGLGVYIIREIMDHTRYEKREGGGMRLTMSKAVSSRKHSDQVDAGSARDGTSSAPAPTSKANRPAQSVFQVKDKR